MRKLGLIAVAGAVLWMASAGAQTVASDPPKEVISNGGLMHTLMAAPVTGQPYSAVQVSRIVRTLADGTTIKNGPGPGHAVMRDGAGRVRVEKWMIKPSAGDPAGAKLVFVLDPVEHTLTTWSVGGKGENLAMLYKLPADKPPAQPVSRPQQANAEAGRPQPIVTTENLSSEIIEGLPVDVVKTTTIVPPGRAHSDAPITRTHEIWTSQDMKLVMKEESTDPRTGDLTIWLTKFSRAEPDPAMFRAPPGYQVKTLKQTLQELADKLAQMPD